ncbi:MULTISPECIES: MFS transporter [Pseudarthrobacter]|uniref:MFS family permease n=1 Tax=Pseudarthrobacter niigatensis TaxID=369935 RepID=A0AAJ1ST29_9MICC|nr:MULTISPECIES: MFS transporter [Pseudarthrobacter]MDQ0145914.1 MFS family permease [Pseudarthrobacter niigatensis]MDQ0266358.1 MFS family permease [Pseudarthrobacter niigatensis]QDG62610.1 MFS transporter [Pseudarthrobacter sp. NIBRBAC000502771]QDG89355.1 MFS transporter [Pseudarthrobacter sp. NIBRBAC000502770]
MTSPDDPEPFNLRSIAVAAFGPTLLFGIGQGAILPVVALSARDLGASVAVAALIVTLIGLGSWFFNLPASLVTLRFGERWSIVGAAVAAGLALAAAATSSLAPNGLWLLAVAMTVVGMSGAVFGLARQKYLTEAVPVAFRARALSTLGGVNRIGVFIGPFAGAAVMQFFGIAGAYWVGVVAMAAAALLSLTIPDLTTPEVRTGADAGPQPTLRSVAVSHAGVFLSLGVGILLLSALRSSRQVVIPLWSDHLGMDATSASLIYGLSGAIDMLVFYPAGKLMDRKGRQWVAVPSTLLMGTALLLIPLTGSFVGLLLAALLIGFGNGISSGLVMTLGADFSPDRGRGQFLGLWRFMADAGSTGGPVLLSGVTALASLGPGIAATGVLGFAAAAVFAVVIPRLKHRRNY